MKIFNSCDNRLSKGTLPEIDLLVWKASLAIYKEFGYQTKLYCKSEDIPYLKHHNLLEMYDEINTEIFDNHLNPKVNEKYFWSYRKMEALRNEFNTSKDSIYSDTDILMFKPFQLPKQALFWCKEEDTDVYMDWNNLSKPKDYTLPNHIKETKSAYNCGIIWIQNTQIINEWYEEYMKFAMDNPCKLTVPDTQNNVFACNSEQRMLTAVCEKYNIEPDFLATAGDLGLNENGIHLYVYKIFWKYRKHFQPIFNTKMIEDTLDEVKNICYTILSIKQN